MVTLPKRKGFLNILTRGVGNEIVASDFCILYIIHFFLTDMKNFIFGFLIAVVIVATGFTAFYFGTKQKNANPVPTPTVSIVLSPTTPVVSISPMVGGDKDEHGCIGSAGYVWCAVKNKCLRSWEEPCSAVQANDTDAIIQALVKKHNWNSNEIEVTISKNDGTYASGGVKDKGSEVGGGYFFAVKDKGEWKIVADGNGTISCASLVPYPNYPSSMISECFDEATGKSVKR